MKTSPTKEVPSTEEELSQVTKEEEAPAPEVNGHAEEVEEKEEVKSEQVKEKEAESHSNASADTEVPSILFPRMAVSQSVCSSSVQSTHGGKHGSLNKLVGRSSRGSQCSLLLFMMYKE